MSAQAQEMQNEKKQLNEAQGFSQRAASTDNHQPEPVYV
jgi:hypothetical protein